MKNAREKHTVLHLVNVVFPIIPKLLVCRFRKFSFVNLITTYQHRFKVYFHYAENLLLKLVSQGSRPPSRLKLPLTKRIDWHPFRFYIGHYIRVKE